MAFLKRIKGASLIIRLLGVLVLLSSMMYVAALPAQAQTASIDQIRIPAPNDFVINDGTDTELFWWRITGLVTSTPVIMKHSIRGPGIAGPEIVGHTEITDIRGDTFPIFNTENTVGQAEHGNVVNLQYAHAWDVPAGQAPGTYYSRVEYYSQEISGDPPSDAFDSASEVSFLVQQPWLIFKYNDLDGSGTMDAGEPGLDGWNFTVTGPGGYSFAGETSGGGFLVLPNALQAGAYTVTEINEPNWLNTDPGDVIPPLVKVVNIPEDLDPADPSVFFGNLELAPYTDVDISVNPSSLPESGGNVTLYVSEYNDINSPALSNVSVVITGGAATYTLQRSGNIAPVAYTGGDIANTGILDPGETWTWTVSPVPVAVDTMFQADGHGWYGSPPVDVSYDTGFADERAYANVTLLPPPNVPGVSNLGIGILIAGFVTIGTVLVYRRSKRSQMG